MLDPSHPIAKLLKTDSRYKLEAYAFLFESLTFAQNVLEMGSEAESAPMGAEDEEGPSVERHVSGQQLCEAIRQLAIQQYGYMAKTVLNSWGIQGTGDFGQIVFNLIEIGQMRKTPSDRCEDFCDVYDFETAFQQDFKIES